MIVDTDPCGLLTILEQDTGPNSFKNRLVERDKCCVICETSGTADPWEFELDGCLLNGAHIVPLQYPMPVREAESCLCILDADDLSVESETA